MSATQKAGSALSQIVVAHRDSGGAATVYAPDSRASQNFASISPDGRWMAYTSSENGRSQVYVSAFPKPMGRYVLHPAGASVAFWRSDSRMLFFGSSNRVYSSTFTPDGAGGAPQFGEPKLMYTRDPWGAIGVSPDGKTLAFVDRVREGVPLALVERVNSLGGAAR